MELIKGTCFFCANSKVVSDFESVHSTIITLFSGKIKEDKLINLKPPKVCPLCYHSFVLMKRTHDDILHSSSAEKVHENCHLCGNSEDVINVSKWTHFKSIIGRDFPCSNDEIISNVCSDCLYYLETKSTVKEKLISEYPILKQESIVSQFEVLGNSTPTRRTRTKAERKSPIDIVDLTVVEPVPSDNMKFKPLKTDRHLRRSKTVNTDPKLLNQVLIIKLPNQSLEDVPKLVRKSITPKRVRFRDEHEHIIDKYNSPSLYTDKENAYKETEELVEYEIKTTPRRSRYRGMDDSESSPDSLDPRKKSFFKIKLMKKKPKSIIAKPFKPVTKEPVEKYNDAIEKQKNTIGKRKIGAQKHKENMQDLVNSVCKYNLVVNLERMNYSEINSVAPSELPIDELDPLRIDSWEETLSADVNYESNKQSVKTKTSISKTRSKRSVRFAEEKVKEVVETNGRVGSKNGKKDQAPKEKVKVITSSNRRTSKRNSIITVSSEDDFKAEDIKKPRALRKRRNTVSIEESNTTAPVKAKKSVNGTVDKKSAIQAKEIKKPLRKRRSSIYIKDVNTTEENNVEEAVNGSEETELNSDTVGTTTANTNPTEESNIKEGINGSEEKESDVEIRAADSSETENTEKVDTETQEEDSREVEIVSDSDVAVIDAGEKVVEENSEKCDEIKDASSDREDKSENGSLSKEDENVQNESLDTADEKVDDNDLEKDEVNEIESAAKGNEKMDTETLDKEDSTENENVDKCDRQNSENTDEEDPINLDLSDTDQTTENEVSRKEDETVEMESEKEVTDQDENKNDNEISDKDDSKILDESSAIEDNTVEENMTNCEKENDNVGNESPEQERDQTEMENFDEVEDKEDQTENENPVSVEDKEERTEDEEVTTADEVNTADEETTADEVDTADSSQLEENTETEEKDSQDVSIEQNGENTEEDLSQDIEENDLEEMEEENSRNKDVTEQQEIEANGEIDNGETDNGETDNGETDNGEADNEENLDESKNEDLEFSMSEADSKSIEATLAAFEGMSYAGNEDSEIVNLDTSCEMQNNEVAGEKRKRGDSEDSLSDQSSPDTKRKKVTFNEDLDENV
ncbi:uncharacterized protein [Diabrotica undecimpunctata]|uniref:uncharacterized protein isoform X1 n=1 Tax=Diabrotica undecimpunctata TaxID=50387 RepID=UPI003B636451